MNQRQLFLKVAALASSLLLTAGFVAYRANAFHWNSESGPADFTASSAAVADSDSAVMSGSKSARIVFYPSPQTPSDSTATVMSGSKSAAVFTPGKSAPTMSSSKGGAVFPPQAAAPTVSDTTIMSSSKSFIVSPIPPQAAVNGPASVQSQSAQKPR